MSKDRSVFIDAIGIGTVALILLASCLTITGRRHLRAIADNDAVGYTTAARSLAQTGRLTSHIVYPSTLSQKTTKSTLYMPGFYVALAAAYRLFHFGTNQSLSVIGAAYIVAAIGTYLIGVRFFDRMTAILGAGFFLIYPANLYFSATAMTELPLVASSVVALCVFIYLPARWRAWIGPILLLLPFLFRETGAFLALPMAIILLLPPEKDPESGRRRAARAAIFLALSVVLLGTVYASPVASGRPSLIKLDIFIQEKGAERIYRDALAFDDLKPTAGQWMQTLGRRCVANIRMLAWRCGHQQREFFIIVLLPLLVAVPVGFAWGAVKKDPIAIAAASLLLLTLGFVCMFYSVRHDRPVRVAMFAFPLVALVEARLAMAAYGACRPIVPEAWRIWLPGIAIVGAAGWVFAVSSRGFNDQVADIRHPDVKSVSRARFCR